MIATRIGAIFVVQYNYAETEELVVSCIALTIDFRFPLCARVDVSYASTEFRLGADVKARPLIMRILRQPELVRRNQNKLE